MSSYIHPSPLKIYVKNLNVNKQRNYVWILIVNFTFSNIYFEGLDNLFYYCKRQFYRIL